MPRRQGAKVPVPPPREKVPSPPVLSCLLLPRFPSLASSVASVQQEAPYRYIDLTVSNAGYVILGDDISSVL